MLSSVHIENIALIKSLDINFNNGFSAFTGETGAGKSIVIDAIGMACGAKVAKEIIRNGETEAKVEALFCDLSDNIISKCASLNLSPDEDGSFYIIRTLNTDGKSTASINGKRVPITLLRDFASLIINIHGQHDNADLLKDEKQLGILDSFSDNEKERKAYFDCYAEYRAIEKSISELAINDMEKKRQTDILKFQIDEIKSAKLKAGEEEKLLAEKKKLRYSEKINKNAQICYSSLYDGENGHSAVDSVERAISAIDSLDGIVDGAQQLSERLEAVKSELIDIAETAIDYADDAQIDPTAALDRIESRLDKISKLCSKYGAEVSDVIDFCESCEKKLSDIELSEEKIKDLEKQKKKTLELLQSLAEKLSETRRVGGKKLSALIENELLYLDMKSAKFAVYAKETEDFTPDGKEKITFMISTNSGEGFNELSKTASGGELSRIMLAIKTVLAGKDGAECLIFDEIDTGISGSTSRKIGIKLKALAKERQVLCVTHSAQVASLADEHFKISKSTDGERTRTSVNVLSYEERVSEIARIISGMDISDASRVSAKELIDNTEE